jgi:hypothetical protein
MNPWLEIEGNEGEEALAGNRAGFELLRDEIGRLLEGSEDSIRLTEPGIQLQALRIAPPTSTFPPLPKPETLRSRITSALLTIVFLSIPCFAIYGSIHFLLTLFHF